MSKWNVNLFGLKIKGSGEPPKWYVVLMMMVGIAILAYLVLALVLYASIQLYPWVDFSWVNAFWFAIVVAAAKFIFGRDD